MIKYKGVCSATMISWIIRMLICMLFLWVLAMNGRISPPEDLVLYFPIPHIPEEATRQAPSGQSHVIRISLPQKSSIPKLIGNTIVLGKKPPLGTKLGGLNLRTGTAINCLSTNMVCSKRYTDHRTFFRFTLHIGKKSVNCVWVPTLVPIRVT